MGPFLQRLKEAIMPFHEEAEKLGPLQAIVSRTIHLQQYRFVLERLYGFVVPAEKTIEALLDGKAVKLDYKAIRRSPHLKKDLAFLGATADELDALPVCEGLSTIDTVPKALGVLYLFEGSRLGGQVIAKHLRERFHFSELQGYSYFGSNGANVGELWQSFRQEMNRYVSSSGHEDEIIESSRHGFAMLNKWLLERESTWENSWRGSER